MFKTITNSIVGSEQDFSLQEQIFHRVLALSGSALLVSLAITVALGMHEIALMLISILSLLGVCYWTSRVLKRYRIGFYIFVAAAHALLFANFFLNNGINGSSAIVSVLIISIILSVGNNADKIIWSLSQLLTYGSLVIYQYYEGNEAILAYPDKFSEYLDRFLTFGIAVAFLYVVFRVIFRKNESQQKVLLEKEKEIREQRDKLKASNDELYKLLSLIAHDVRNPLATIESYLDPDTQAMMQEEERADFNEELVHLVRNTSHMLDETLHWSKNQIDQEAKINYSFLAIGRWLNSTIDHVRGMAKSKNIILIDSYDGAQKLNCDPNLLTVVIRNILQNAIKFTDSGKTIIFDVLSEEDDLVFRIQDEGMGMNDEQILAILGGAQTSTRGTKQETGTGFGLKISLEYIRLHQGELKINSKPGEGSCFEIYIPKQPA